jgi:hypothetical protein
MAIDHDQINDFLGRFVGDLGAVDLVSDARPWLRCSHAGANR